MIRIVQWGSKRSIVKVYRKDESDQYTGYDLLMMNNDVIVNLESNGITVTSAMTHLKAVEE